MSKIIPNQRVKRPSSAIAGASGSDSKKRSRKLVEITEDVWLEALKHLSGTKWSKMRLVTRELYGVVERNVSRLPMVIINSADIGLNKRQKTEVKMIVLNSTILPREKDQWFLERDIALDLPTGIQLDNAIIGMEFKTKWCADLCILGTEQEKKLTSNEKTRPWYFGQQFKTEILFYAEFSPHRNKYSWASISFFLNLLYDQSTYIKHLSMYAIDTKLKNFLFANQEDRYIRCGSFTLQKARDASIKELSKSVSWLEQNIQADNIRLPEGFYYDAMINYLLGAIWISASQVVKLGRVYHLEIFFKALIKKFRTVSTVQSIFPTVLLSGSRLIRDDPLEKLFSRKSEDAEDYDGSEYSESDRESENTKEDDDTENEESDQELENSKDINDPENRESDTESSEDDSDDSQSDDDRFLPENYGNEGSYTISNGPNRMRIEFVREYEKPRSPPKFRMMTCARITYGYDIRVTFEAKE